VIRVVLFGACGRMGTIAAGEIAGQEDFELVAGVERPNHPQVGGLIGSAPIVADEALLPDSDAWLDFSLASPSLLHARRAATLGKPLVIAATGFSSAETEEIEWLAKRCPLLVAPNLSTGVGALENLAVSATRLLSKEFDSAITETHHKTKKDAPSGTAKRIAERMAHFGSKPQVLSIRAGGAIGEHRVSFTGSEEELVIIHRAWSRRAFSSGVPRAVRFIVHQAAGLYSLQDIYGLE
jgi:4-hydroxy-tetrahydrodipicolinate reductase